jgi:hypothetical protein
MGLRQQTCGLIHARIYQICPAQVSTYTAQTPQYAQHSWTVPAYGQLIQYAPLPDAAPPATDA